MKKLFLSALVLSLLVGTTSTSFADYRDDQIRDLQNRVAGLERQNRSQSRSHNSFSDNFNIMGELRLNYWNDNRANDDNLARLELSLLPSFRVNENLTVRSRITGFFQDFLDNAACTFIMTDAFLEYKEDNFTVNAGKFGYDTQVDRTPNGSVISDKDRASCLSGIQFMTGDETKIYAAIGRMQADVNYFGAEVTHKFQEDLNLGAAYHYINGKAKTGLGVIGGNYQFTEDWNAYASIVHNFNADDDKTGYNLEFDYLGANPEVKSSWGAYVAYRSIPKVTGDAPGFDSFRQDKNGKKGFEIGGSWTPIEKTQLRLGYFNGKSFNDVKGHVLFARASVFF